MKNIYCLLLAAGCSFTGLAQSDEHVSRWYLGVNAKGGMHNYDAEQVDFSGNYPKVINPQVGEIIYTPGKSMGADIQVAYFIGKKANFGLGLGLQYLRQSGDATMDKFHIEYQGLDFNHDVYRQIINAKAPIKEEITATNITIPVLLKYRVQFSKVFGLNVDAGIVYNLSMRNKYTTNASFDYESVYKFARTGDGSFEAVYDAATVPGENNWKMTAEEYKRTKPSGDVQAYFASLRAQGYNVGLNEKPTRATGYKSYEPGSIGFLVQPSLSFRISEAVSLNVGGYFMHQTFKVNGIEKYMFTEKVGEYSSIMGAQKDVTIQNYGGSLGLGFKL